MLQAAHFAGDLSKTRLLGSLLMVFPCSQNLPSWGSIRGDTKESGGRVLAAWGLTARSSARRRSSFFSSWLLRSLLSFFQMLFCFFSPLAAIFSISCRNRKALKLIAPSVYVHLHSLLRSHFPSSSICAVKKRADDIFLWTLLLFCEWSCQK